MWISMFMQARRPDYLRSLSSIRDQPPIWSDSGDRVIDEADGGGLAMVLINTLPTLPLASGF
jgi:hypothetical protein